MSAATLMTSPPGSQHADRKATISDVARDLIEGAHVLRSQPVARALLPVTVLFLAANASLSAVLIPFAVQRLGGSEHTGFLLSCLGIGFLAGAPAIRALLDRVQPRHLSSIVAAIWARSASETQAASFLVSPVRSPANLPAARGSSRDGRQRPAVSSTGGGRAANSSPSAASSQSIAQA